MSPVQRRATPPDEARADLRQYLRWPQELRFGPRVAQPPPTSISRRDQALACYVTVGDASQKCGSGAVSLQEANCQIDECRAPRQLYKHDRGQQEAASKALPHRLADPLDCHLLPFPPTGRGRPPRESPPQFTSSSGPPRSH